MSRHKDLLFKENIMKRSSVLLSTLAGLFLSTAVFADSGLFAPVPTNEGAPLRIMANVQGQMGWDPFQLRQLQGGLGAVYGVGMGFDVGAVVNFGGMNKAGMFNSAAASADSLNLGGDVMVRLLGNVTEMFYLGLQATGGLHYDFSESADFNTAASTPVTVGFALGLSLADTVNVYLYPEMHFGGKATGEEKNLWGTDIGLSVALGTMVNVGDVFGLTFEAKQNWADYKNSFTVWTKEGVNTQVSLGFVYDM